MTEILGRRKQRALGKSERVWGNGHLTTNDGAELVNRKNACRIQAVQDDSGFLVQSGVSVTLMELCSVEKNSYNRKRGIEHDIFEARSLMM